VCIAAANAGPPRRTSDRIPGRPTPTYSRSACSSASWCRGRDRIHRPGPRQTDPRRGDWPRPPPIGTEAFPAPQGTLMATLSAAALRRTWNWQFVLVGVFLAVTIELCGVFP